MPDSPPILAPLSPRDAELFAACTCDICFTVRCTHQLTQYHDDGIAAWQSKIYVCEPCGKKDSIAPSATAN